MGLYDYVKQEKEFASSILYLDSFWLFFPFVITYANEFKDRRFYIIFYFLCFYSENMFILIILIL